MFYLSPDLKSSSFYRFSTPLTPLFVLSQLLTDMKVSLFSTFLDSFIAVLTWKEEKEVDEKELDENLEMEEEDEIDQKVQDGVGKI